MPVDRSKNVTKRSKQTAPRTFAAVAGEPVDNFHGGAKARQWLPKLAGTEAAEAARV